MTLRFYCKASPFVGKFHNDDNDNLGRVTTMEDR